MTVRELRELKKKTNQARTRRKIPTRIPIGTSSTFRKIALKQLVKR